jgi:alpha-tubulin suppressor-like RCC1 family protein
VEAWGSAAEGEAVVPAGVKFKQIAGGNDFSLGITMSGSLMAWGSNTSGQLNVRTAHLISLLFTKL